MRRLFQIACRLFNVSRRFYQLVNIDDAEFDDSMSLFELMETVNDVQFKLISTADVKCSIFFEGQTTTIPANNTTLASTILEEALEKFLISKEDIDMYVLKLPDDPENPSYIDMSMSINDLLTFFSTESKIISLRLTREWGIGTFENEFRCVSKLLLAKE